MTRASGGRKKYAPTKLGEGAQMEKINWSAKLCRLIRPLCDHVTRLRSTPPPPPRALEAEIIHSIFYIKIPRLKLPAKDCFRSLMSTAHIKSILISTHINISYGYANFFTIIKLEFFFKLEYDF